MSVSLQSPAAADAVPFGDLVRYWRRVRAMSQLDLASAAMTTPRHMSFLETGRSSPSREMVLRLAGALDVPLRDRNGLLLAAGYAPLYPQRPLDDPGLDVVMAALDRMLERHDPLPAVVMDRGWDLVRANAGARRLFGGLFRRRRCRRRPTCCGWCWSPGPCGRRSPTGTTSPQRCWSGPGGRRSAASSTWPRPSWSGICSRAPTSPPASPARHAVPLVPVVDIHFRLGAEVLRFFSMVSTVGTPVDVTAQELRVEAFFPADDATSDRWHDLST